MNTILSVPGYSTRIRRSRSLLKVQTKWIVTICMLRSRCSTKEMGWDPQLGCPTRETLQRLGLEDIAADLAAHNLLPA